VNAETPAVLTIAGSDSGGGAGIQADLKTFHSLGTFGASAITCITAQNPDEVAGIMPVDPDMVALQVRTVCKAFPVAAAKTGMLYSSDIIRAVASVLRECNIPAIVVDPVMVATSGARLLQEDAIEALQSDLLPLATVITPNLPETEILAGRSIANVDQLKEAAAKVASRFGTACLAKGGHLAEVGDRESEVGPRIAMDVLCCDGEIELLEAQRLEAAETHGTGCTLSAALAAYLARGEDLAEAATLAKDFVSEALRNPFKAGAHTPLGIRPPSPL